MKNHSLSVVGRGQWLIKIKIFARSLSPTIRFCRIATPRALYYQTLPLETSPIMKIHALSALAFITASGVGARGVENPCGICPNDALMGMDDLAPYANDGDPILR